MTQHYFLFSLSIYPLLGQLRVKTNGNNNRGDAGRSQGVFNFRILLGFYQLPMNWGWKRGE